MADLRRLADMVIRSGPDQARWPTEAATLAANRTVKATSGENFIAIDLRNCPSLIFEAAALKGE